MEDAEGSAGAEPAFGYFFKVVQTVLNVALGVFVWQVEQVHGAGCVGDVDDYVADLAETVGTAV